MASKITRPRQIPVDAPPTMHPDGQGFDVVATIGSVRFGDGPEPAVVAAMKIIGEHAAEGTYRFPHEDGGEWVIDMQHSGRMEEARDDNF